ncbi:CaiB/BaiF CoA transferase family protein, partial [Streptomyces geysiriensis]|uniref:CaiB/BaiF CoA transferase family protein n=1 Tax=Streptomyces geysiriensis TaxID=68207 RepID=UPI001C7DC49E
MQPLRGITVVSLEQAVAAPYASRQLADLGARVIKVERPGTGDFARAYDSRVRGLSSHFVWVNRNKESVTLDFKDPRGREVLRRLIAGADVFLQNLAPGAAARAGLGAEELLRRHPALIVCEISGYGSPGPYEGRKAYDLMVQAEAGLLSVTGTPEEMAKVGVSVSDIAAGMYAYSSVLAALLERGRTGRGAHLDVSMLESTVEWMGFPLYYAFDGAEPPPRAGAAHATIHPYGPYTAGDGKVVMMAIQNEREWRGFCARFLGRPELAAHPHYATNADRNAHREELGALIAARFAELTGDQALELLGAVPVANARVSTLAEVWDHPQLAARGRRHEVPTQFVQVQAHLNALRIDGGQS